MKVSNLSFIPFQKTLVAKCAVLNRNRTMPCSIYYLDENERQNYLFDKIKREKNWNNSWLAPAAFLRPNSDDMTASLYVIENKNKCLGFVLAYSYFENTNEVHLLEVRDDAVSRNKKRTLKYTGQSLMAFLAALSKKQGDSELDIVAPIKEAVDFYKKGCLFEKGCSKTRLYLKEKDFDKLIELNEQKTGKRVRLIG